MKIIENLWYGFTLQCENEKENEVIKKFFEILPKEYILNKYEKEGYYMITMSIKNELIELIIRSGE
jgi:uncharacterized membrane protein